MTTIFGTAQGTQGSKYTVWAEITQNSRSFEQNTSNITVTVKLKRNDGNTYGAFNNYPDRNSLTITLNGVQRYSSGLTYDTGNCATATLGTFTGDVEHDNEGVLSLPVSITFVSGYSLLEGAGITGTFTGASIPRASTLALSVTSLNHTQDITATITPSASSFSHAITYSIGSYSQRQILPAGTYSNLFTVPQSWANAVANSRSASIAVKLDTYTGSTLVGTRLYYVSLTIPNSNGYIPSFSLTIIPVNNRIPAAWGVYVRGMSGVTVTAQNINYKYSASFQKASITVGGVTKNTLPAVFDTLNESGNITVTLKLTDSRGLSKTITSSITVVDYANPGARILQLSRCTSNGTPSPDGTYIKLVPVVSFSPVNNKNSTTCSLTYKEKGSAGSGTNVQFITRQEVITGAGNIDVTKSYEVTLSVTDGLQNNSSVTQYVGAGTIPFNIRKGGKGVGIGKYCQADNQLQSGWDVHTDGKFFENGSKVVESGGGQTGNWAKFSDGMMIECGKRVLVGNELSLSNTFTSGASLRYSKVIIQPSQAFTAENGMTATAYCADVPLCVQMGNKDASGRYEARCWSGDSTVTSLSSAYILYMIVGRWK